jgi:bifunctional dethiobiotin synthetase / adenosylmethionine---8-amino-7-oxononanoate aminotransferase
VSSDPLFQYALAKVVRESDFSTGTAPFSSGDKVKPDAESQAWSGLPVICDEVFTGFVGVQPDIAVHAKLLTGGLVPLCLTVASNHVYNAFLSDQKSDALLHGHSYTAHAVGCEVARESLRTMQSMEADGKWDQFKTQWEPDATKTAGGEDGGPWSMWSKEFVTKLSHHEKVDGVFGLGSVLVIALKDPSGSGKFPPTHIGVMRLCRMQLWIWY